MPELLIKHNLGLGTQVEIHLSDADFIKMSELLRRYFSQQGRIFPKTFQPDYKSCMTALHRMANYVCSDQIRNGVGQYGWGKSEKIFARDVHGKKTARDTRDSVHGSVVSLLSLYSYYNYMVTNCDHLQREDLQSFWSPIKASTDKYLQKRWDATSGKGGVVTIVTGGDEILAPSCRHTAWLLTLWLSYPPYTNTDRIEKTARALLQLCQETDIAKERVATPIAVRVALEAFRRNYPDFTTCLSESVIAHQCTRMEDAICSMFDPAVSGWWSGISSDIGRQSYTLFALSELGPCWHSLSPKLQRFLKQAMNATWQKPWFPSTNGLGYPRSPNTQSDLSVSCLALSALLKWPLMDRSLTHQAATLFDFILLKCLNNGFSRPAAYSWMVAYLLKDLMCELKKP